ncbi:MAG: binding-protein-dependent transport system inner rane component, partial [Acidimicrobiaceae bacterium]|nr:binding-protein-dependent transport system inner rane component [Acidimicrobiaceae bacterium]
MRPAAHARLPVLPKSRPQSAISGGVRVGAWARNWVDRRFLSLAAIPGFALLAVVSGVPMLAAVFLSFTVVVPGTFRFHWIGLANYRSIFQFSGLFNNAIPIENTYIFAGLALGIETVLGVLLAVLLAQRIRGIGVLRAIYALPLFAATIGSAVAWSSLLNRANGWVDYFLGLVGLGQPIWLADPHVAMISVVIADAWSGIPVIGFIVLAGLLSLPREPLEA